MTPEQLSKGIEIGAELRELRREIRILNQSDQVKIFVEATNYTTYYNDQVGGGTARVFGALLAAKEADLVAKEAELAST